MIAQKKGSNPEEEQEEEVEGLRENSRRESGIEDDPEYQRVIWEVARKVELRQSAVLYLFRPRGFGMSEV